MTPFVLSAAAVAADNAVDHATHIDALVAAIAAILAALLVGIVGPLLLYRLRQSEARSAAAARTAASLEAHLSTGNNHTVGQAIAAIETTLEAHGQVLEQLSGQVTRRFAALEATAARLADQFNDHVIATEDCIERAGPVLDEAEKQRKGS